MGRLLRRPGRAPPGAELRLGLLFGLAIVPFVCLLLVIGISYRHHMQDDASRRVVDLARTGLDQENSILEHTEAMLSVLGAMPEVRAMGPSCHALLGRYAGGGRPLTSIFVSAADGRVGCSSAIEHPVIDVSDREFFRGSVQPHAAGLLLSGPLVSRRTNGTILVGAVPLPIDPVTGRASGVIGADLDLSWLDALAARAGGRGAVAALVDTADGSVPAQSAGYGPPGAGLGPCALPRPAGVEVVEARCADGVRRVYGTALLPIGRRDFIIAVGLPSAEVVADADWVLLLCAAAGGLATAAGYLSCRVAGRRLLMRPLRHLTEAAQRMGAGDLDAEVVVPAFSLPELRTLGASFNQLAGQLRHRLDDLGRAREEQASRDRLHRIVTENVTDVIVRVNAERRRVYVSPSCKEVLGYAVAEMLDGSAFELVHPDDRPLTVTIFDRLTPESPAGEGTWRMRRKDGSYIWIEARYRLTPEDGGIVVVLRDISRRKLAEARLDDVKQRLELQAMCDGLTGLPNRRRFLDAIEARLHGEGSGSFAVLFVDLDRFKPVNDLHGHGVGDLILAEAARRLQQAAGEALVARLGGDEFAVLQAGTGEAVTQTARRIVAAMARPIAAGGVVVEIGATVGISLSPLHGTDTASLLRTADIAMYHAKRAGRGSFRFFEIQMEAELKERTELQQEVRHALAGGEIVPYFHPLIDLRNSALVGMEALARWEHPIKGTLLPARFIPAVEEMGVCRHMFETILSQACAAAAGWPRPIKIAVNLSPAQLQDESLPATILGILGGFAIDPRRLELDVVEDVLASDQPKARRVLASLRRAGIGVALDDFGAGHSSLCQLSELQFDRIKLDPSFTRALASHPENARYVSAIVGFCRALDLELTAEGIEDLPTMERLKAMGCSYGQGFLFGHPVPAAQVPALLQRFGAGDRPELAAMRGDSRAAVPPDRSDPVRVEESQVIG